MVERDIRYMVFGRFFDAMESFLQPPLLRFLRETFSQECVVRTIKTTTTSVTPPVTCLRFVLFFFSFFFLIYIIITLVYTQIKKYVKIKTSGFLFIYI